MSDLTESFYQRLPAGGEMLRREKRKRNNFLEEMGISDGGGGGGCGDERDSTCISVPTTGPAGTGARRGRLLRMGKTDKDLGTGRLPKTRRR